ncbi:Lipopolysaccharide core heptose(I) kinase RfaP [Planctomycetes bacterium Pan216]|uniref:Lipopolysaccharide core heptose(I) kinase RfaP n=1 Tax=Kolteria novifilia TaxID=2527975 RepID=A0A518AYM9_9BACT|nr:Lipopolysaccharide core heptose(I) kinase RfaP [Planctomycetes bacterium Pan216]
MVIRTPPTDRGQLHQSDVRSPLTWPHGHVCFDEGRLWVHPDYVETFQQRGWTTLEAVMQAEDVTVVRRVGQRDNTRLTLARASDGKVVRAYMKRHVSRCFGDWLFGIVSGRGWSPPGIAEAESVAAARRAGVATMTTIAAGCEINERPWQAASFFVSEEIDGGVPADDFWRAEFPSDAGGDNEHDPRRDAVIEALARSARRLHGAGMFHRDFYWCHFFVRQHPHEPGKFAAHLIDLQRIVRRPLLAARWRLKDLAQFVYSIPEGALSNDERRRWFEYYRDIDRWSWSHRLEWAAIRVRAWFYRVKERL